MATKRNPGKFDCYDKAEPDEPLFTLLGRDRHAPLLVEMWANMRQAEGEDPEVVAEARACAEEMRRFRRARQRTAFRLNEVIGR